MVFDLPSTVKGKISTRSFREPSLFSLPFDMPMSFDASKESPAYDLKHYGNDLFDSTTRTFRYAYMDGTGNTSFVPLLGNGSRCFGSNPFSSSPISISRKSSS